MIGLVRKQGREFFPLAGHYVGGGIFQDYLILSGFTGRDQQRGKIGLTD